MSPRIVGHRGASVSHKDNTLEAFVAAREVGADGIELDVRRTKDDVLVCHHDAHLADGRLIRKLTADELPTEVPNLAQALLACSDMWINVEIKNLPADPDYDANHGISVAVAGLINAFNAGGHVLVSSFHVDSLLRIRRTDPAIKIGWLCYGSSSPVSLIHRAAGHQMNAINPHDALVDAAFVKRAHDVNLEVNVWTVDDPERMLELRDLGVDSIITNDPQLAVETFRAKRG